MLVSITYFNGFRQSIQTKTESEDPSKQIVSNTTTYNHRGQVAQQWLPFSADVSYDDTAPPDYPQPAKFEYDPVGRLVRTINPDGTQRTSEYNDWTVINVDENGHQTDYINDAYGRLIVVREHNDAEVYTTQYFYNAQDNLKMTIDDAGNVTSISYDSLGRKGLMRDPDMGIWYYEYDAAGNLISQTDAKEQTIEFRYDELNRLEQKIYQALSLKEGVLKGETFGVPFNPNSSTVTYRYDDDDPDINCIGRLRSISDASGITLFYYDERGREILTVRSISGIDYIVERTFDSLDRLTSVTYPDGEIVSYTYNSAGQLEQVVGDDEYVNAIDYRASGQMEMIQYGNGVTTNYTYDDETLRIWKLLTNGGALQNLTYQYGNVGNIKSIADAVNTVTQAFDYDDLNRLIDADGQSYGSIDYGYDSIGNRIKKGSVTYGYGEDGRGGPHALTSSSDGLELTYDANGNMIQKGASVYEYDYENRLIKAEVPQTGRTTVQIKLTRGWNFFSLPVIPDDLSIEAVLLSIIFKKSGGKKLWKKWKPLLKNI